MAAYTTIDDAGLFFNTVLYTGTGTTHTITGVGFQPDFVWAKSRSSGQDPRAIDAVRGGDKVIYPDLNNAEATDSELITSFNSDGYVMGTSGTNANDNTVTYVSWNWKGGTTAVPSGGTITPTACSFSATAGFGIYAYAGNSTAGATIAHGLGAVPALIICKRLNSTGNWSTYQHKNTAAPETDYLLLNTTAATADDLVWNDTAPTSSVYSLGNDGSVNTGFNYVSYVWTEIQGFSKFGGYTGNGNADGVFVYTGFRPAFFMVKRTDSTNDWYIVDNKRLGYNVDNNLLFPNLNAAENTGDYVDILSNGLKTRTTDGGWNTSGATYIYAAFAEAPFVNSNGVPCNAR